jgi:hypothetical protein
MGTVANTNMALASRHVGLLNGRSRLTATGSRLKIEHAPMSLLPEAEVQTDPMQAPPSPLR